MTEEIKFRLRTNTYCVVQRRNSKGEWYTIRTIVGDPSKCQFVEVEDFEKDRIKVMLDDMNIRNQLILQEFSLPNEALKHRVSMECNVIIRTMNLEQIRSLVNRLQAYLNQFGRTNLTKKRLVDFLKEESEE